MSKFFSNLKFILYGEGMNFGTRIHSLSLNARDKKLLDKVLPKFEFPNGITEEILKSVLPFSRIFFASGIILIVTNIISYVSSLSVERTLLFGGLISIILSTGPSVFLSKKKLETLDALFYHLLLFTKSISIYWTRKSLCLSDHSTKSIKIHYVLFTNISIFFISITALTITGYLVPNDSILFEFSEKVLTAPSNFMNKQPDFIIVMSIFIPFYYSLILSPDFNLEKKNFDKGEYKLWTKRFILWNLGIVIVHLAIIFAGQIYMIRNSINNMTYEILFSFRFIEIYWPMLFLYIQVGIVVVSHQIVTMRYMNNKSAVIPYLFLILFLSPYYIFYYLAFQLIPNLIINIGAYILLRYFELCKFILKVPSVVRVSGFLIALTIALYKFFSIE